jgi:hypothetical protein
VILRRIAAAFAAAALALTFAAPAAEARDTGWDCPGCKIRR